MTWLVMKASNWYPYSKYSSVTKNTKPSQLLFTHNDNNDDLTFSTTILQYIQQLFHTFHHSIAYILQ